MSDLIDRQAAIKTLEKGLPSEPLKSKYTEGITVGFGLAITWIEQLPAVQPEPLSDAYTKAVWTWLLDYQIKAAELKGRYTPYEVLSWVANDWRKEHEGSD
jgi:hypothetical protein